MLESEINIIIFLDIHGYKTGYPARKEDPGADLEIDFDVYVKNEKGENVLLQDEICLQYADELYEIAKDSIIREVEDRIYADYDHNNEMRRGR